MIRKAEAKDIKQIKNIFLKETGFRNENWRKNVLELGIKSSGDLSFVFQKGNKIIGFICVHDVGFRAYLSELITDPEFRNKGVGKALLERVEKELRKRGCRILISDVWIDSVGFYEKLGWSEPDVKLLRKKL